MEIQLGLDQMDMDQTRREIYVENMDILTQPDGEVPLEQPKIWYFEGWRCGRLQDLSRAECDEDRRDRCGWSYR